MTAYERLDRGPIQKRTDDTVAVALIEIQRTSGGVSDYVNPFEVVIDGEVVGRLGPAESGIFEVTPGTHEILAKAYWCRSEKLDVDLRENQKLTFSCEMRAKNFLTEGYWATFGCRRALKLTEVASGMIRASDHAPPVRDLMVSQRPAEAAGGQAFGGNWPWRSIGVMRTVRWQQPALAGFLLVGVAIVLFALTLGLEFLVAVSIIYIGVQAATAINFHLLAPRSVFGGRVKSHEPIRFRALEQAIISAGFAIAGVASVTGVLGGGSVAGWIAIGASAAGALNLVGTRPIKGSVQ